MALNLQRNVVLKPYTTFKMGGKVAYMAELRSKEDLVELSQFAKEKKLPLLILGGGSNVILPSQGTLDACVGLMKMGGFTIVAQDEGALVIIGAGEEWDNVVARCVAQNLSGIEALSAIPGSSGATPVQNVGAYGQEISQVLESLEAYDTEEEKFVTLALEQCVFSYRDSIFKHTKGKKYIITSITLRLSHKKPQTPNYPGVEKYFLEKNIQNPTISQIRDAIIEIRKFKLPDPKVVASCGSFFKNPVVSFEVAERIKKAYPEAIMYEMQDGTHKIGAGWMIDKLGFKGKEFGNLELYPNNALVLINKGGATRAELEKTVVFLITEVEKAFGVTLEPEPVFIS